MSAAVRPYYRQDSLSFFKALKTCVNLHVAFTAEQQIVFGK